MCSEGPASQASKIQKPKIVKEQKQHDLPFGKITDFKTTACKAIEIVKCHQHKAIIHNSGEPWGRDNVLRRYFNFITKSKIIYDCVTDCFHGDVDAFAAFMVIQWHRLPFITKNANVRN